MRQYGFRALALLLLLLSAAFLVSRLPESRAAAAPAAASAAEAEDVPAGQLLIRSEQVREALSLYTDTWRLLERMRLDESGESPVDIPGAGNYYLVRGDGRILKFTCAEDGAVTVTDGNGFGAGRILELTNTRRGTVLVRCTLQRGAKTECRLEGGGAVLTETLAAAEDGSAECRFCGLPMGRYQLYLGGDWTVTVAVTAESPDRTVSLS